MKKHIQDSPFGGDAAKYPHLNIEMAWRILSRLGLPARYGGRAPDGSHEYIILDPSSGDHLTTGRGASLEESICNATQKVEAMANDRMDIGS